MGEEGAGALCPSARCEDGAILLGIVAGDGRVAYLTPEVRIDQDFVERARQGRSPEKRFRFAQPCAEGACGHWTGSRCGLVENVVAEQPAAAEPTLPRCSIRRKCRWFAQRGREACSACPLVIQGVTPTSA
jgi:hypothetical protein